MSSLTPSSSSLPESVQALIFSFLSKDEQSKLLATTNVDGNSGFIASDADEKGVDDEFLNLTIDDNDDDDDDDDDDNDNDNLVFNRSRLGLLCNRSTRHFIVDQFLQKNSNSISIADVLTDANRLFAAGKLRRAGMAQRDTAAPFVESSLRGDSLVWLDDTVLTDVASLRGAVLAMRAAVTELSRSCGFVASRTTVQLARYPRGARYVRHLDATAVHASARRLTLLLYLNPNWTVDDGGQLRMYLPDGATRDIDPIADRLLVFQSHGVPHEVLESHAEARYSLTLWVYGDAHALKETPPAPTQTPSTEN
jgi:SM-20-related protein